MSIEDIVEYYFLIQLEWRRQLDSDDCVDSIVVKHRSATKERNRSDAIIGSRKGQRNS